MRFQTVPVAIRLERNSVRDEHGCLLWTGALNPNGYGKMQVGDLDTGAHRVSYTEHVGPIPDGFEVDHLCKVRHCIEPTHLEAVTSAENTARCDSPHGINARKVACIHGHPFDDENTYWHDGRRRCRKCRAAASRRYVERKAMAS